MKYILIGLLACYVIVLVVIQIKAAIIWERIGNSKITETVKYKVGDRVRIKNFDWFKNCGVNMFVTFMAKHYGEVVTIKSVHKDFYRIKEDGGQYCWTDDMIECKIEE